MPRIPNTSRDHVIETTAPGMVTITGGKWTTYRKMAEDAVNRALIDNQQLAQGGADTAGQQSTTPPDQELVIDQSKLMPCHSIEIQLVGSAGWSLQMPEALIREGIPVDVSEHLSHNYGDRATAIAKIASDSGLGYTKLAEGYPFLEAEVIYSSRHEYAFTAVDIIAHRTRLAFLNSDAALQALPRVIQLMSQQFNWDSARRIQEYQRAVQYINTMNRKGRKIGLDAAADKKSLRDAEKRLRSVFDSPVFPEEQIEKLRAAFKSADTDGDDLLTREQIDKLVRSTPDVFGSTVQRQLQNNEIPPMVRTFYQHLALHAFDRHDDTAPKDSVGFEEFLFSAAAAIDQNERKSKRKAVV